MSKTKMLALGALTVFSLSAGAAFAQETASGVAGDYWASQNRAAMMQTQPAPTPDSQVHGWLNSYSSVQQEQYRYPIDPAAIGQGN